MKHKTTGMKNVLITMALMIMLNHSIAQDGKAKNNVGWETLSPTSNDEMVFILKNGIRSAISIAIVYFDEIENCWVSMGWYNLEPNEETSVNMTQLHCGKKTVYVHAHSRLKNWGSDFEFCTNMNDSFKLLFADNSNCISKAGYYQHVLEHGVNRVTFTKK